MKKHIVIIAMGLMLTAYPAIGMAGETGEVQIHGFISQGFLYSNTYNYLSFNSKVGSFEYSEMGINFGKQLADKLRFGMQLFARDIGDAANHKITLDWAYGDYRYQDWLGLRAGRIKLPIGLYNETRDIDMLRTSIVLPQGIYYDLLRDNLIAVNGVGFYGNPDLRTAGGLNYQLLAGALYADIESGVAKYVNDISASIGGEINGDIKNDTTYAGAIQWDSPLEGLKIGYSFFNGVVDMPVILGGVLETIVEGSTFIGIYSAEYTWNNLVMAAEYIDRENWSRTLGVETTTKPESYYLSASYAFNDLFTLGVYYSEFYPDKDDKEGNTLAIKHKAWEKDLALTLRFNINDYWIFKIEGHTVDGTANVLAFDNANNAFSDSNWYYGAAKVSFSF